MSSASRPVILTGDSAHILKHIATQSWGTPPPDERVTVRERTAREYLAGRRAWWIFWTLMLGSAFACLGMLLLMGALDHHHEAQLALTWACLFTFFVVVSTLVWWFRRAVEVPMLGPLDAPRRVFHVEPDALVVEAPDGSVRRLPLTAVTCCEVEGQRIKHGWALHVLTLGDRDGVVELRAEWLPRDRVLVALAERLLRGGAVVARS